MGMLGQRKRRRYANAQLVWPYNTPHFRLHGFALFVNESRDLQIRRQHPSWVATNGRCFYCGEPASVMDHVLPKSLGGDDRDSNLVAACFECNSAKSGNPLEAFRMMRAQATGAWCQFSPQQLAFLRDHGFVMPPFPGFLFWGEVA